MYVEVSITSCVPTESLMSQVTTPNSVTLVCWPFSPCMLFVSGGPGLRLKSERNGVMEQGTLVSMTIGSSFGRLET